MTDIIVTGSAAKFVHVRDLLDQGESLAPASPFEEHDPRKLYGYNAYPIERTEPVHSAEAEQDNGVVLVVEPNGGVEPVKIVNEVTLLVQALHGKGRLVVAYPETDVRENHVLDSDGRSYVALLGKGAVYCYKNTGPHELVVRDDSLPAFQDGDERPVNWNEAIYLLDAFDD